MLAVSYQYKACVIRDLPPFMEIEGNRIGALDALQARRYIRRQYRQGAVSAVNVKPELFATGKFCNSV